MRAARVEGRWDARSRWSLKCIWWWHIGRWCAKCALAIGELRGIPHTNTWICLWDGRIEFYIWFWVPGTSSIYMWATRENNEFITSNANATIIREMCATKNIWMRSDEHMKKIYSWDASLVKWNVEHSILLIECCNRVHFPQHIILINIKQAML